MQRISREVLLLRSPTCPARTFTLRRYSNGLGYCRQRALRGYTVLIVGPEKGACLGLCFLDDGGPKFKLARACQLQLGTYARRSAQGQAQYTSIELHKLLVVRRYSAAATRRRQRERLHHTCSASARPPPRLNEPLRPAWLPETLPTLLLPLR